MGTNEIDQTSCFTFYFAKSIYNLQLMQKSSVHGRSLERFMGKWWLKQKAEGRAIS